MNRAKTAKFLQLLGMLAGAGILSVIYYQTYHRDKIHHIVSPSAVSKKNCVQSSDEFSDIERRLCEFNCNSDHYSIAALLSEVRHCGRTSDSLKTKLLELMSHRASIYDGRLKSEVIRLRAYVLLTLVDTGNSKATYPYICDYVKNADDYGLAYETGVGVYAAGTLGPLADELLDDLVNLFHREFSEPEFSLDRYSLEFPPLESTSVKLEIIHAIRKIGVANNERALELLQACAANKYKGAFGDSRIADAASSILLNGHGPDLQILNANESLQLEASRLSKDLQGKLEVAFIDQEGREGRLCDLIDRPTAIVFFYTRCTNSQKCSATISRITELQQLMIDQGVTGKIRLLGITYEPKSDDSIRLKNYGLSRNLKFDDFTRFLRLDPRQQSELMSLLEVPVSYSDGWVNTHSILLLIVGANHKTVARYETVAWNNQDVLQELLSAANN